MFVPILVKLQSTAISQKVVTSHHNSNMAASQPEKRAKLDMGPYSPTKPDAAVVRLQRSAFLSSLSRSVSPPSRTATASGSPPPKQTPKASGTFQVQKTILQGSESRRNAITSLNFGQPAAATRFLSSTGDTIQESISRHDATSLASSGQTQAVTIGQRLVTSPFQLIRMQGLSKAQNLDTITVKDILGDVMIKEAWVFNFLFDVDWMMGQFDSDTRGLVSVKLIHGFWKREDPNKADIDEACSRYPNVEARAAWLEDPFGTHHTKMIILFRHDDSAQVIIGTANMIPKDWTIMTNAVWRSPLLPLLPEGNARRFYHNQPPGSGPRFKHDLLQYLAAYGRPRIGPLIDNIERYDFSAVRGALIGSTPSKVKLSDSPHQTRWGWPALKFALDAIVYPGNVHNGGKKSASSKKRLFSTQSTLESEKPQDASPESGKDGPPYIVCQVSSIGTPPKSWFPNFFSTLRGYNKDASISVIFPTQPEVRTSLGGYASGGSIFMKVETTQAKAQLESIRPHLCHWSSPHDAAGRSLAAPHIKTYIRFSSAPSATNPIPNIDWALLSSANLSAQAWGSVPAAGGGKGSSKEKEPEVRISSYELGVLVWPELYSEGTDGTGARMVPVFGKDMPEAGLPSTEKTVVGLRMPYDLPLTSYARAEMPWAVAREHTEPDGFGNTWPLRMG